MFFSNSHQYRFYFIDLIKFEIFVSGCCSDDEDDEEDDDGEDDEAKIQKEMAGFVVDEDEADEDEGEDNEVCFIAKYSLTVYSSVGFLKIHVNLAVIKCRTYLFHANLLLLVSTM